MPTSNKNKGPGMHERPAATSFLPSFTQTYKHASVEYLKVLMNKRSHMAPSKANRHFWQLEREVEGRNILH